MRKRQRERERGEEIIIITGHAIVKVYSAGSNRSAGLAVITEKEIYTRPAIVVWAIGRVVVVGALI